jgi:hypothetical protein
MLFILSFSAIAQLSKGYPKNSAGTMLIVDGTTAGGTWGLEYERYLFATNHLSGSIRANYIDKYQSGNFGILFYEPDPYDITLFQLWGTGYLSTSRRNKCSGFILSASLGLTNCVITSRKPNINMNKDRYSSLRTGWELGTGVGLPLSSKTSFRLMFTLSFTNPPDGPPIDNMMLGLFGTKISIGF